MGTQSFSLIYSLAKHWMNFKNIIISKYIYYTFSSHQWCELLLCNMFSNMLLRIIQCMNVLTHDLINPSNNKNLLGCDVIIATIVVTCVSMYTTPHHNLYKLKSVDKARGFYYSSSRWFCDVQIICAQHYVSTSSTRFSESEMFCWFKLGLPYG